MHSAEEAGPPIKRRASYYLQDIYPFGLELIKYRKLYEEMFHTTRGWMTTHLRDNGHDDPQSRAAKAALNRMRAAVACASKPDPIRHGQQGMKRKSWTLTGPVVKRQRREGGGCCPLAEDLGQ